MKKSVTSTFTSHKCLSVPVELNRSDKTLKLEYEKEACKGPDVTLFFAPRLNVDELLTTEAFNNVKNGKKNRYHDIPCWDLTRVILSNSDPAAASDSDYIHANYVNNFQLEPKFIATQTPMHETIVDFFNMIWQNECRIIVVLTEVFENGQYEIEPYWSTFLGLQTHGKYTIATTRIDKKGDYTKYYLGIRNATVPNERRIIRLYHYTKWPVYGTPRNTIGILAFVSAINAELLNRFLEVPHMGPIVVHGDAGAGRTGTFCTIDVCFEQWLKTHQVDILKTVKRIRRERHSSVMTADQYIFIFHAIKVLVTTNIHP